MTNKELKKSIECPLFATRDTVKEAYDELLDNIELLPNSHKAEVLINIHVLLNSIAKEIIND